MIAELDVLVIDDFLLTPILENEQNNPFIGF
jgi:hypothetical protein